MAGDTWLVTGAASGIGRAVVDQIREAGSGPIIAVDLQGSPDDFPEGTHFVAANVADEAAWNAIEQSRKPGSLRGVIICAGIARVAPLSEMEFGNWRSVMSANLDGAFLAVRTALRLLDDNGHVVLISSATARKPAAMTAAYGASKAAVEQLVRVAALEAAPRGIRVNAVAPGGVKTPMFSDQDWFQDLMSQTGSSDGAYAKLAETTPLGQFSEPADIAALVLDIANGRFGEMTGAIIPVDGGYGLT